MLQYQELWSFAGSTMLGQHDRVSEGRDEPGKLQTLQMKRPAFLCMGCLLQGRSQVGIPRLARPVLPITKLTPVSPVQAVHFNVPSVWDHLRASPKGCSSQQFPEESDSASASTSVSPSAAGRAWSSSEQMPCAKHTTAPYMLPGSQQLISSGALCYTPQ